MERSVLVTILVDKKGKPVREIYGKFNPVSLQRICAAEGLKIESSEIKKYIMDEETFVKYGKEKKGNESVAV